MHISNLHVSFPLLLLLSLPVVLLAYLIHIRFRLGLRSIPGPFLASISPVDRLITAARGHQYADHIAYHKKYGSMVRIGPNHVSLSNPELIPIIYNIGSKFYKSDFYSIFDVLAANGSITPTVFSVRDQRYHTALKRPVASAYSMSTMKDFEPMVDSCVTIFCQKMTKYEGRMINFGTWLHWFAWDVISSITFSNRLGFLEQEKDVEGIIRAIEVRLAYNATIGEAPYLHKFLMGNKLFTWLSSRIQYLKRLNAAAYIVRFSATQLERYRAVNDLEKDSHQDMLARFKKWKDGEMVMSNNELLSHASSNIFAGSDTTAISLRSIFWNLCRNAGVMRKAVEEVVRTEKEVGLSEPVSFNEGMQMEYVQAVIKEGLRLHPAVGMLLERVVPPGGATLEGVFFPAGTIVGVNPWVVSRDKKVFGADAEDFRPERWLEANQEQLKLMERNFLAFGAGARTCLGKNVSLFEITKLVPEILRRWDVELKDGCEMEVTDHWFARQSGLMCRLRRRA